MNESNRSGWPLSPSQQAIHDVVLRTLNSGRGGRRPFLLYGNVGVGKTFLVRRLCQGGGFYCGFARECLGSLLAREPLAHVAPEGVARLLVEFVREHADTFVVVDGLEVLLSSWAEERPEVLANFFLALGRTIADRPMLAVVQTSSRHLSRDVLSGGEWWPRERSFELVLRIPDSEVVARNWDVDPMRAHVSSNLYELLAHKLGG